MHNDLAHVLVDRFQENDHTGHHTSVKYIDVKQYKQCVHMHQIKLTMAVIGVPSMPYIKTRKYIPKKDTKANSYYINVYLYHLFITCESHDRSANRA